MIVATEINMVRKRILISNKIKTTNDIESPNHAARV